MSCMPTSQSLYPILDQNQLEESPVQRRGNKAYQIFPEATITAESESSCYPEEFLYKRERLPSIVVEPMEQSELENGVLCWPPRHRVSNDEMRKEEENRADPSEVSVDGEQQEEGSVTRKSSIGPSQSQQSLIRLTPPASPTPPESPPPCPRS